VDRPRPLRVLRDLFVYAPVGFLLEAPRLVPELVETGRERLTGCRRPPSSEAPGAARSTSTGRRSSASGRRRGSGPATLAAAPEVPAGVEQEIPVEVLGTEDGDDAALAIPSYDQLAASQVVARLAGLDAAELAEIEAYEQAHRARRTVLSRISQLLRA
jgi:hypothetical protein